MAAAVWAAFISSPASAWNAWPEWARGTVKIETHSEREQRHTARVKRHSKNREAQRQRDTVRVEAQ